MKAVTYLLVAAALMTLIIGGMIFYPIVVGLFGPAAGSGWTVFIFIAAVVMFLGLGAIAAR